MVYLFSVFFLILTFHSQAKSLLFLNCSNKPCKVSTKFPFQIPKQLKYISAEKFDVTLDLNEIELSFPPNGKSLYEELNDLLDILAIVILVQNKFQFHTSNRNLNALNPLETVKQISSLVISFDFYYLHQSKHYFLSTKTSTLSKQSQIVLFDGPHKKNMIGFFQVISSKQGVTSLSPIILDKKIAPKNFSPLQVFK